MDNGELLTNEGMPAIIEEKSTKEVAAEHRSTDPWDHSRTWNMPAGWVVPGIEHPDDVVRYEDAAEDRRIYREAGGEFPVSDAEYVRLFRIAAELAARAIAAKTGSDGSHGGTAL